MQHALISRHVGYAFVDSENTRIGKRTVPSGVYPAADSSLTAVVVDARASRDLESGDSSSTIAHVFDRLGTAQSSQPLALRIDLDDSVSDATATVGFALSTLEATPWATLLLGSEARPGKSARRVTFVPIPTKNAPAHYWATVRSARAFASGMIAALTSSDGRASRAQADSLLAESSGWSEPSATWAHSKPGLAFATAALRTANNVFNAIKLSTLTVTLPGAAGNVPVTIQNNSKDTLNVVVLAKTSSAIRVLGKSADPHEAPAARHVRADSDRHGVGTLWTAHSPGDGGQRGCREADRHHPTLQSGPPRAHRGHRTRC